MNPTPPRLLRSQTGVRPRAPDADTLAAEVLAFLAEDAERCAEFLEASGLSVADLRAASGTPAFAEGLLDHLCADDARLLAFAESRGYDPASIERLRRSLGRTDCD